MGRLLPVIFIFLCALSSFLAITDGLAIKIIRRDKVDTNLFPKNLSDIERNQVFADLSLSRALYLKERAMKWANSVSPSINQTAGIPKIATISPKLQQIAGSIFLVPVTIGSKGYSTHLLLDTGSDFIWLQCSECEDCFHIKDGPFNHKDSSSYRELLHNDQKCRWEHRTGNLCIFEKIYLKGEKVTGIVSEDSFLFTTKAGSTDTVRELLFGCATSAPRDLFKRRGPNNPVAGIFGIGEGQRGDSFMVLQNHITKSQFSYCLPPWNARHIETNLLFGDDIQPLPTSAKTIPMQTFPHYTVSIEAISVASKRLGLGRDHQLASRLILDTGSSITSLVGSVYDEVKAEFTQYLDRYMKPVANPMKPSELCYQLSILKKGPLPSLTFHFNARAELEFQFSNVFLIGRELVCMMIKRSPVGVENILGAVTMANHRFVHNLSDHRLSFYPEECKGN